MYRTILFDLDGTLADSREGIVSCARYAIQQLGDPVPEESVLFQFAGPPLHESFGTLCGYEGEKLREAIRLFRARYDLVEQSETWATPGMAELLARLRERGYTQALASSKVERLCRDMCERFHFAGSLQAIVGSNPDRDWSKADVIGEALGRLGLLQADRSTILMVGDRWYDVAGAKAWGIDCAGFQMLNYAPPGELEQAGAVAVVDTVEALEEFILSH